MSSATDPAKRIPKSLGTDTQFLGKYSLTDLAVAGLPGVLVVLVTQVVIPPSLTVRGIPVSALTTRSQRSRSLSAGCSSTSRPATPTASIGSGRS